MPEPIKDMPPPPNNVDHGSVGPVEDPPQEEDEDE
jgi:hypothetical protein